MKVLYIEPFAGISGNMLLGALLDAGVPFAYLQEEFAKLHLGGYELIDKSVNKSGIQARYFNVVLPEEIAYHDDCVKEHHQEHEHGHNHDDEHLHHHSHRHHHDHRNLREIEAILDQSGLPGDVIGKAKEVFLTIARAEAKVHGTTVEKIHFHEVGAIDTIIDVVGNILALRYLGIEKIFTAPVNTGFGFVQCAHGQMPVPAPATAELLQELPHYRGTVAKEMTTPTGAALLKVLAVPVSDVPSGFIGKAVGYGAGTRDVSIPNVLRINVGVLDEAPVFSGGNHYQEDTLLILECNLDDINPEILPYVMEKLLDAGALDVWLQPILMKKGRPGQMLKVLCRSEKQDILQQIIFMETTTLGIRSYPVKRISLERRWKMVETSWGSVRVKEGLMNGKVVNAAPEFEDCRKLAEQSGQPLKTVEAAALKESLIS